MMVLKLVWFLPFLLAMIFYFSSANAATPFFAENKFTENGIEWCEEERQRFEVLGDFWYEHHNYSIESRICGNLYEDPLWHFEGEDRTQKLIERSAYYVELEIAESEEEAKTGITDPSPAQVPEETVEEESSDEPSTQEDEQQVELEETVTELEQQLPTSESDGGCLIATAAFGSELSIHVQQLREIRDNVILNTQSGTAFLLLFNELYYLVSPPIADLERQSLIFKEAVKILITPLLATLSILTYVDIDSEHEMILYGVSIISLNLGMYIVTPLFLLCKVKRKYF